MFGSIQPAAVQNLQRGARDVFRDKGDRLSTRQDEWRQQGGRLFPENPELIHLPYQAVGIAIDRSRA